jgi:hypothetical protein
MLPFQAFAATTGMAKAPFFWPAAPPEELLPAVLAGFLTQNK